MSAFVVESDTMDTVVSAICGAGEYGPIIPEFAGILTSDEEAPTKIGRKLFAMNLEAVRQRYPDTRRNPNNLPGPCDDKGRSTAVKIAKTYSRKNSSRKLSAPELIAAVKAMECLTYQCSEGNVDETDLYAELKAATGKVAIHAVNLLPEYEAAPWG